MSLQPTCENDAYPMYKETDNGDGTSKWICPKCLFYKSNISNVSVTTVNASNPAGSNLPEPDAADTTANFNTDLNFV